MYGSSVISLGLLKSDPLAHGWNSSDFATGSVVSDAKTGKAEDDEEEEVVMVLSTGETVSNEEHSAVSGTGEV